jgi:transcriptional regulator with XRE-family HTH domain
MNNRRPKIKKAIQDSGLKQKFVADKLGVSEITLSYYISGTRNPSRDRLRDLAKVCRCKISDLED